MAEVFLNFPLVSNLQAGEKSLEKSLSNQATFLLEGKDFSQIFGGILEESSQLSCQNEALAVLTKSAAPETEREQLAVLEGISESLVAEKVIPAESEIAETWSKEIVNQTQMPLVNPNLQLAELAAVSPRESGNLVTDNNYEREIVLQTLPKSEQLSAASIGDEKGIFVINATNPKSNPEVRLVTEEKVSILEKMPEREATLPPEAIFGSKQVSLDNEVINQPNYKAITSEEIVSQEVLSAKLVSKDFDPRPTAFVNDPEVNLKENLNLRPVATVSTPGATKIWAPAEKVNPELVTADILPPPNRKIQVNQSNKGNQSTQAAGGPAVDFSNTQSEVSKQREVNIFSNESLESGVTNNLVKQDLVTKTKPSAQKTGNPPREEQVSHAPQLVEATPEGEKDLSRSKPLAIQPQLVSQAAMKSLEKLGADPKTASVAGVTNLAEGVRVTEAPKITPPMKPSNPKVVFAKESQTVISPRTRDMATPEAVVDMEVTPNLVSPNSLVTKEVNSEGFLPFAGKISSIGDELVAASEHSEVSSLDLTTNSLEKSVSDHVTGASLTKGERSLPVNREQLFEQMVERTKIMVHNGQNEMEISLKPDHLGRLQFRLSVENHLVTANFVAESAQVKEVIESNLAQLKQQLQEAGITLDAFSVSVGGEKTNKEGLPQAWHQQNGHSQQRKGSWSEESASPDEESTRELRRQGNMASGRAVDLMA